MVQQVQEQRVKRLKPLIRAPWWRSAVKIKLYTNAIICFFFFFLNWNHVNKFFITLTTSGDRHHFGSTAGLSLPSLLIEMNELNGFVVNRSPAGAGVPTLLYRPQL